MKKRPDILTVILSILFVCEGLSVLFAGGVFNGPGMELKSQNLSVWKTRLVWVKNFTTGQTQKDVFDYYRGEFKKAGWKQRQAVALLPTLVFNKDDAKTIVEFIESEKMNFNVAKVSFVQNFDGDWGSVMPEYMLDIYPYGNTVLFRHVTKKDMHTFMRVLECSDGPDIFMRYAIGKLLDQGWKYNPRLADAAMAGVVFGNLAIFNRDNEQFTIIAAKRDYSTWNYTLIASKSNMKSLAKEQV